MLKCEIKHISIPKLGNEEDENEDKFNVPNPASILNDEVLNFTISDGATESYKSKLWASLLCNELNEFSVSKTNILELITSLSKKWYESIDIEKIPWYAIPKFEKGAHATFLNLKVNLNQNLLTYFAIGDSCFFHIRENNLLNWMPVKNSITFNSNPELISSNPQANSKLLEYLNEGEINLLANDFIIVCTDAIAQWFLSNCEKNRSPWLLLQIIFSTEYYCTDFVNWLNDKRNTKEIKDDDSTVILIYI